MLQQAATIESLPVAFEMIKAMQAQGLRFDGEGLGRGWRSLAYFTPTGRSPAMVVRCMRRRWPS